MLKTIPRIPLATHCHNCEFSFPIDPRPDHDLWCCTLWNVHTSGRAILCPRREDLNPEQLQELLLVTVPPWMIALEQQALGDKRTTEQIANEIAERTGLKLSTEGNPEHEVASPQNPTK